MKKIAVLLIICLALSALAGCARADEGKEEFATLTQPEQIIQKDEVAKKEEPIESDLKDEPDTDEPNRLKGGEKDNVNQLNSNELTNEMDSKEKETLKNQTIYGNVPEGAQFDLSSLSRMADRCVGVVDLLPDSKSLEDLQGMLNPQSSIVFRGKINGKSTQYKSDSDGYEYIETPILVQEVYYGDVKVGDVINCYENMFVHTHDGEPVLEYYGHWPPVEKDEEYLFMVHRRTSLHKEGGELYFPLYSRSPYIKINELKVLQEKDELNFYEKRNLEILTYYYLGQRGGEK